MIQAFFLESFAAYHASSDRTIPLPSSLEAREIFFTQGKEAIVNASETNQPDLAQQYVDFARTIYQQHNEDDVSAWAAWCQGLFLIHRDKQASLAQFEQARAYYARTGNQRHEARVLVNCIGLLGQLGRFEEAEAAIQKTVEALSDWPTYSGWPAVYLNQSEMEGRQGKYEQMLESAKYAEQYAKELKQPLNQARSFINQSIAAIFLGNFSVAEDALGQAEAHHCQSAELAGRIALNRARLALYRDQLFAALEWLGKAEHHFVAADIQLDLATVALETAPVYERLNLLIDARAACLQAARAMEREGLYAESLEALIIAVRLSLNLGKRTEARRYIRQAQPLLETASPLLSALLQGYAAHPLLQETPEDRHAALSALCASLARLRELRAIKEYIEIQLLYAQTLERVDQATALREYASLHKAAQDADIPALVQSACVGLASLLPAQDALPYLREAVQIVTDERHQMPAEELKAHLLQGHHVLHRRLVTCHLELEQSEAALAVLLDAKGGLWTELHLPPSSQSQTPELIQARMQQSYWKEEARYATEQSYRNECIQRVAVAEQCLIQATRRHRPRRPPLLLPTVAQIQQQLPPHALALEYMVSDSQVWVCIVTHERMPSWINLGAVGPIRAAGARLSLLLATIYRSPLPEQRQSMTATQLQPITKVLADLYSMILQPVEPYLVAVTDLILAPDDFLFDIPWAALSTSQGWLGAQYTLKYVPSLVLGALVSPTLPYQPGRPLALSWPGEPALRYLEEELAALQEAAPDVQCSPAATSKDLTWERSPRFLHIAAHGILNHHSPMLSAIELADGPFSLIDVMNLDLHGTDFVTLSGCETNAVPERGGILLAIAGAFLSAGANSVLASLWPVDDEVTQIFMGEFYRHLQQGVPIVPALQAAQGCVRAQGFAHPFFWAAFQPLARTF